MSFRTVDEILYSIFTLTNAVLIGLITDNQLAARLVVSVSAALLYLVKIGRAYS